MSVQTQIDRIKGAVQAAHEKVAERGGTTSAPFLVDNLAEVIDTIPEAKDPVLQTRTISPITSSRTYYPDSGYDGFSSVTVNGMPTSTPPKPTITVGSTGIITARAEITKSGFLTSGSFNTATKSLEKQEGGTITPTTTDMVLAKGKYIVGDVTIKGDANLVPENIAIGVSIFGVQGTYKGRGFDMITSSTLPSGVTEDQIIVITDTPAGTFYIDTDEPVNPVTGDVWIKLEAGADVSLTVTEESPYLRGGMTEANQWNGNSWENRDGYIGIGGEWVMFAVAIPPVGTPLNEMTWQQISTVAQNGLASTYFNIGDTKEIVINGKIGEEQFTNVSVWAYIIGFDHNATLEGANRIHFQIGKSAQTNGTSICLVNTMYRQQTSGAYFNMNKSQTTSGGWQGSYMRNDLLGNSGTPSTPPENSLMAALPSDLLGVLKGCQKFTDNVGVNTNISKNVSETTDYLWLLSEYEVSGAIEYSNQTEKTYQKQYDYYSAGNSMVKYAYYNTSETINYWTRSACIDSYGNSFCNIYQNGILSNCPANYTLGISPAFCV